MKLKFINDGKTSKIEFIAQKFSFIIKTLQKRKKMLNTHHQFTHVFLMITLILIYTFFMF